MKTIITLTIGWIAGLSTFSVIFAVEAARLLRRNSDINDHPTHKEHQ